MEYNTIFSNALNSFTKIFDFLQSTLSDAQIVNTTISIWTIVNIFSDMIFRQKLKKTLRASEVRLYYMTLYIIGSTVMMSFENSIVDKLFIITSVILWMAKYIIFLQSAEEYSGEQSKLRLILQRLSPSLETSLLGTFKQYFKFLNDDKNKNNDRIGNNSYPDGIDYSIPTYKDSENGSTDRISN